MSSRPVVRRYADAGAFLDDAGTYDALPGVIGPKEASRRFAELWAARSGSPARLGMTQRIYRASGAERPKGVPGSMRRATEADRALLIEWTAAFFAEALPDVSASEPAQTVDDRLGAAQERAFAYGRTGSPCRWRATAGRHRAAAR